MAVTIDSKGIVLDNASGSTSINWVGATNTSGTTMLVYLMTQSSTTGGSMTYDGVSATLIDSITGATPSIYVFKLDAPSTGTKTLFASWTGSSRSIIGFVSFTGAGIPVQTIDKGSVTAGTSNFSTSLSLSSTDLLIGLGAYLSTEGNIAVVTGTQESESSGGSGMSLNVASNTGTGSTSVTWSRSVSAAAAYMGIKITEPVNATVTGSTGLLTANGNAGSVMTGANITGSTGTLALSGAGGDFSSPVSDWRNQDKSVDDGSIENEVKS